MTIFLTINGSLELLGTNVLIDIFSFMNIFANYFSENRGEPFSCEKSLSS